MERIWKELHYALRMLRKSPGFTVVAVLTLALGIGANTAMFSVIRAVMLKPLPYHQPERLFRIRAGSSYPDLQDLKENSRTIQGIAGYREHLMDLTSGAAPERLTTALVTGDLFKVLGVKPRKGRLIVPADDVQGSAKVVVISETFWKGYLGNDPDVIGKSISIASSPYTIIGVLPPDFELPFLKALLYAPIRAESPEEAAARGAHSLRGIVRLAQNITLEQAQSDFDNIGKRLEKLYPEENSGRGYALTSWHEYLVNEVRPALLILLASVAFVLLIACTNVANLFLTRAAEREKEMAVRTALGASRSSLFRLLIIEGLLLSFIGAAVGLIVAIWISELAIRLGPEDILRLEKTRLDPVVFAATFGLSILTGLLFSLGPGLYASKTNLEESLKEGSRATGGFARQKMRNILAVLEVAIAMILLIGAGLLIRSFWLLKAVQPGFRTDRLLTMNFTLPLATYSDIQKRTQFFEQVLDRLKNFPGVESVGATSELPFGTGAGYHNLGIEGRPVPPGKEPEIYSRSVSIEYFRTLGIPVLQGRAFNSQDRRNSLPVAIVNQTFVRRFFPDENPIGKRIAWIREVEPLSMQIIGVVSDVKSLGLHLEEEAAVYTSFAQEQRFWKTWMNVVLRTSADPSTLISPIRKEVALVDRNIPVADLLTMENLISESVGERKFHFMLLGLFAGLALLLAAVGIYGILSYSVRQRTQEMGIRVVLGASRREILSLILKQGLRVAFLGATLGLAGALIVTRFLRNLLYAIGPTDLITFVVVPIIVIAVALLACYAPARRATRINPIVALRYE